MRLTGILIMAVSLTGTGFVLAERGKKRLSLLIQLRQMIYYLKSQILYSNATLPEAVCEVGNHFRISKEGEADDWEPALFFLNIRKALEKKENLPFSDIWYAETERIPPGIPLTPRDRKNLGALGKELGYADRDMQERALLFFLEQLDEAMEGAKAEAESTGKLYRTLGVAAGMFWFILLI